MGGSYGLRYFNCCLPWASFNLCQGPPSLFLSSIHSILSTLKFGFYSKYFLKFLLKSGYSLTSHASFSLLADSALFEGIWLAIVCYTRAAFLWLDALFSVSFFGFQFLGQIFVFIAKRCGTYKDVRSDNCALVSEISFGNALSSSSLIL